MVIECDFNINLTALTLEEVLGKRRKVVKDMCDQLAVKARQGAQGGSWSVLRTADEDSTEPVPRAVEACIKEQLMPLAAKDITLYNENASMGQAIIEAVAVADILAHWPAGLEALAKVAAVGVDVEKARNAQRDKAGAVTVEQLMQWEGPLAVCLRFEEEKAVPTDVMHGLCALMWVMHAKGAPLILDLSKCKIGADGLAVLARGMAPSLTTLLLDGSDCTNNGGDFSGLKLLCSALESVCADGLKELRCAFCPHRERDSALWHLIGRHAPHLHTFCLSGPAVCCAAQPREQPA